MIHYTFIGEVSLPRENAKVPFVRSFDKNGRKMKSMSFGIKPDRTNIGFLRLFGMEQDVLKAYDTENNPVDIDWADRNDPEVIANVRSSNQIIINLGPGYGEKRFISSYDAVVYLEETLPTFNGILRASGLARHNFYNGKSNIEYNVKNLIAVDPSSDYKKGLVVDVDYFYSQDDIETDKKEHKVYCNGYVQEYISKDEGNKYVQMPLVYYLDGDLEDDLTKRRHKFILDDIRPSVKNKVFKCEIRCDLKNGSDEIPFDETQLTDRQKESIELGFSTIEDFRPRGQIFGQRVNELRVRKAMLRGEYVDGMVDTGIKPSELSEEIYVPPTTESIKDVLPFKEDKPKAETKKSSGYGVDPDAIDDDDLF